MADPIGLAKIPSWLRQMLVSEDAMRFAPRPSVNEIVARMNLPRPQDTEDFLRQLRNESQLAERLAVRATDDAYSPETNIFGGKLKTIDEGRALGERNLPGIDNLPLEDQALLREKLDQAAMLRAMSGDSPAPVVRRRSQPSGLPLVRVQYGNRADRLTGAGSFLGPDDLSMGQALALLGNKRQMQQAGLRAFSDLPAPSAFSFEYPKGRVPSDTAEALGPDVSELVKTIRNDQIQSRLGQVQDMQERQLFDEMAQSADEVAAQEARAREYGGLPPETLAGMDKSNRSYMAMLNRVTENLTGDPRWNWARQMGGNMDPIVGSPLYPPSQLHAASNYPTSDDHFWATTGKNIVKGAALGHVLSYPLIYAAYQMMKPNEPAPGKSPAMPPEEDLSGWAAERERNIAESQAAAEAEDTRSFMDSLPDVPIDMNAKQYRQGYEPEMPQDVVGIADEPVDLTGEDNVAELAAEQSPPPSITDLDEELRKMGLQGVPSWYIRAMKDPSVKMIDGMPKEEFLPFSSKSKEYPIQQRYVLQGMTR